jgi:hypothetical protein
MAADDFINEIEDELKKQELFFVYESWMQR